MVLFDLGFFSDENRIFFNVIKSIIYRYGYEVMLLVYAKCLVLFYMEIFSVVILFEEEKHVPDLDADLCFFIFTKSKGKRSIKGR